MKREIGLKDFGEAFKKQWKTFLGIIIIFVVTGGLISNIVPPTYEAESDLLINSSLDNKEREKPVMSEIDTDLRLVETYRQIMQSDRMTSKVNMEIGNLYTKSELLKKVKIKTGNGSQIITIHANETTPEKAANLANSYAKVSKEEIKTLMGLENITILKDITAGVDTKKNEQILLYYLALSFIVGALISLVIIIVKEIYDPNLDSQHKVEESLGIPLLGTVSKMSTKKRKTENWRANKDNFSNLEQSLASTESFSKLAANIHYLIKQKKIKIIMMVSQGSGEGKTFIGCNLATRLALNGQKTLFIDANLRKSDGRIHFNLPERRGLTSVISGFYKLAESIQNTEIENLSFISTGPLPPNPAQFLQSEKMDSMLTELKELYDVIIIDVPALEVADAISLLPTVDGCIYVANTSKTKEEKAFQSIDSLKKVGGDILGVVLNSKEEGLTHLAHFE